MRELRQHGEDRARPEATRALVAALEKAWQAIAIHPAAGLAVPRPHPNLARPGWAWVRAGRGWVAYNTQPRPVIVAVFHDTADIPGRQ